MKKLLLRLCLFIPILLIIVVVNFTVDPANLYSGEAYITGIAKIILSGKNVANVENYDERLLQKKYIEGLRQAKNVIVLGSSRSMQISSAQFSGKTFFNNSVSVATLEDLIAIYQLYSDNELKPSIIILGIDPWIFNNYYNYNLWRTLSNEYQKGINNLGLGVPDYLTSFLNTLELEKLFQIISPSYFQGSINQLLTHGWKRSSYYSTNVVESDVPIRTFDGSFSYPSEYRLANVDQVRQRIENVINQPIDTGFEHYTILDPQRIMILKKFIDLLKTEGIQVFIFLPPIHPIYYNYLVNSEKYRIILNVQKLLINIGKEKGITILGSYNPADIPCQENEFYDFYHPKLLCIEKVFKELKFYQ